MKALLAKDEEFLWTLVRTALEGVLEAEVLGGRRIAPAHGTRSP
jgi:hypothetical protein